MAKLVAFIQDIMPNRNHSKGDRYGTESITYFLIVAKEQSFTKAAEQLHITQPTLSRQLAALEDELGTRLFCRGGRNITLTDDGLLLKRRALEMIDLEDKIVDEIKGMRSIYPSKSACVKE